MCCTVLRAVSTTLTSGGDDAHVERSPGLLTRGGQNFIERGLGHRAHFLHQTLEVTDVLEINVGVSGGDADSVEHMGVHEVVLVEEPISVYDVVYCWVASGDDVDGALPRTYWRAQVNFVRMQMSDACRVMPPTYTAGYKQRQFCVQIIYPVSHVQLYHSLSAR